MAQTAPGASMGPGHGVTISITTSQSHGRECLTGSCETGIGETTTIKNHGETSRFVAGRTRLPVSREEGRMYARV